MHRPAPGVLVSILIGVLTNIAGGDGDDLAATATTTATSSPVATSTDRGADSPDPTTPAESAPANDPTENLSPAVADSDDVPNEFSAALAQAGR